jgi:uroporphyrinogen-III synthase
MSALSPFSERPSEHEEPREASLNGMRVALLEARMPEELAALVRRHGGEPCSVPAVREERVAGAAAVHDLLERARREAAPILVFSTGVGVAALFAECRALGREGDLREVFRRATAVCRGPKPVAALRREGVEAPVRVRAPYTTGELLNALAGLGVEGRLAVIVHYGERNTPLVEAVAARGARVHELLLYVWRLPEDLEPLRRLVAEIVDGQVGAVVFTSQIQARHLFHVAASMERAGALRDALRSRAVVTAVGPTCARALAALGVPPHVVPENPKMGAMLTALADHVSGTRGGRGPPR